MSSVAPTPEEFDTPEGAITCTGGVNREFTGKNGPEGGRKNQSGARSCHFN